MIIYNRKSYPLEPQVAKLNYKGETLNVDNFDYSGTHLGERKITVVFESPVPIDFQIGDYLDFKTTYDTEVFTLQTAPIVTRVHNSLMLSYTLTFWWVGYELQLVKFLDVVAGEDASFYHSSNSDISITSDLAEVSRRIKYNLDRAGYDGWEFMLDSSVPVTVKTIIAQNASCWDILQMIKTEFAVEWKIKSDIRTIVIGQSPELVVDGSSEPYVFEFGKDKGLCEFSRLQNEQKIITRVYGYGSERNVPELYRSGDNHAYHPRLMMPEADAPDGYIQDDAMVAAFGVREDIFIDDSIYPSIGNPAIIAFDTILDRPTTDTPQQVRVLVREGYTSWAYSPATYPGPNPIKIYTFHPAEYRMETVPTEQYDRFVVYVPDLGFDLNDVNIKTSTNAVMVFNTGSLVGIEFKVLTYEKKIESINGVITWVDSLWKVTLERTVNASNYTLPNSVIKPAVGDIFVFLDINVPPTYVPEAEERVLAATQAYLEANKKSPEGYAITIPEEFIARMQGIEAGLRESNAVKFRDTLMGVGITEPVTVLIQSIGISYKAEKLLPTYTLTIADAPIKGYVQKIESQLKSANQKLTVQKVEGQSTQRNNLKSASISKEGSKSEFLPYVVTPDKVTFDRPVHITGDLTASGDVVAYIAGEVTSDVLDALTVSAPLTKSGTNIALNVNPLQFNVVDNKLNFIGSTGLSSVAWVDVTSKPTTVAGYGLPAYPTTLPANDVYAWAKLAVKPSYGWDEIGSKPATFEPSAHTIASHSDVALYFTGTKALTSVVADSANAVTWGNVSSRPTSLSQFSNDLGNYGGFALQTSISNINNTSDANKPVSTLTWTELGKKVDKVSGKSLVYDTDIAKLAAFTVIAEKVTIDRDLHITGNVTASGDVIAYVASAVTSDVLDALTVSYPLQKTGTNIALNINSTQFEVNGSNQLQIKSGVLAPAAHTHIIANITGLQTALNAKATPADISTAISALVDSSPSTLNTLNELAAALGDDPNFATTVSTNIGLKAPINNPTFTGTVGGITKSMVGLNLADNTADASKPVSTAQAAAIALKQDKLSGLGFLKMNGSVLSYDNNTYALQSSISNINNTSDANKPVSTAQLTALNLKVDKVLGRSLALDTDIAKLAAFTVIAGKVTIDRDTHIAGNLTASADVIAYVAGAVSGTVLDALSVSTPLVKTGTNIALNLNPAHFSITGGQLNYIGTVGMTSVQWSDIQSKPTFATVAISGSYADLSNKPSLTSTIAGATDVATYFTGAKAKTSIVADSANSVTWGNVSSKPTTVAGYGLPAYPTTLPASDVYAWAKASVKPSYTKGDVGLGSVDNTTDVAKPVSTAQQTALNLKANLASPSFTGNVSTTGNFTAGGEVTAFSDRRLKSNIQPLRVRGDLQPVTYIKDNKPSIGFIAQDVRIFYPELVFGDESKEMLSLNYQQLTAVLYAEIIELKNKLNEIEGRNR